MSKIEKYLGIANHDIQVANNSDELKSYVASILCEIDELQQENKILRDNAEHNEKVVDKVNWENMLLKKENKQLKDNWNTLKKFLKNTRKENLEWDKKHNCEWKGYNAYSELLIKMQELEQGSDSNE